ncbi:MAG: 4-(cytidine 5'-diphospho)-2-C-methyl-D-erythritol kinase [Rhodothermaceae bacterium]|nr:4-(cytidine 5'-diphospho)-2-C-methyl-D-erythritol kinase [Rhodothermaceae bacterium]
MPSRLVRASAPAKLNLGLHVLRRRDDGFHDIETVMVPIGWADHLTATSADHLALTCSDPALPTDEENLVVRAALALAEWAGIRPKAALHLEKRVPYGAGLGSGSSDAAATLRLLDHLWNLEVPEAALHEIAATLGSDVPFFLLDGPALATGRGEVLMPLPNDEATAYRCPFAWVVAVPPIHVATGEAYGLITPHDADRVDVLALVQSNDLARWRAELRNDFEAPILARYPAIRQIRERLLAEGAGYAALSGSGAAVFGAFDQHEAARQAAEGMAGNGLRVWWGR